MYSLFYCDAYFCISFLQGTSTSQFYRFRGSSKQLVGRRSTSSADHYLPHTSYDFLADCGYILTVRSRLFHAFKSYERSIARADSHTRSTRRLLLLPLSCSSFILATAFEFDSKILLCLSLSLLLRRYLPKYSHAPSLFLSTDVEYSTLAPAL